MNQVMKVIGCIETHTKEKDMHKKELDHASVFTISEQRHMLINLYTYDRNMAVDFTTENDKLHQLCKSLATGTHKISEKTWKKVAAAMTEEQAKHQEGGAFWHNDPWLPREYTPKLVKKAWSHLTSDDIEALHSFGGSETSYLDQWTTSSYSSAEHLRVAEKDADTTTTDSWADDLSDSESSYEVLLEDAMVTALSPRPMKKSKSPVIRRRSTLDQIDDSSLQKRITGPSFRERMKKLNLERADN